MVVKRVNAVGEGDSRASMHGEAGAGKAVGGS